MPEFGLERGDILLCAAADQNSDRVSLLERVVDGHNPICEIPLSDLEVSSDPLGVDAPRGLMPCMIARSEYMKQDVVMRISVPCHLPVHKLMDVAKYWAFLKKVTVLEAAKELKAGTAWQTELEDATYISKSLSI
jgi:hypothetical protein